MPILTVDDIIAATGIQQCESITDLEILFNSFDEIACLEVCMNLRKLTLLDNGLKRISNLQPVSLTLQSLTLCDQKITKMENLDLPMLRELYLHRNEITEIRGLSSCPRLKKLWLFQNKLTRISGLHSLPELQECWLQANQISQLDGFEHNQAIETIGLAGNPIVDVDQIRKLVGCSSLRDISFSDIHFGRSPVADTAGYKEFIVLHLRQVRIIDGIKLSQNGQIGAEDAYFSHVISFNQSLDEIEEAHLRNITAIQTQYQSKELHSIVLEKEMTSALRELQSLVMSGAQMISKQVARNQAILTSNYDTLLNKIHCLESDVSYRLRDQLARVNTEFDAACAVLAVAEFVATAESALTSLLSSAVQQSSSSGGSGNSRLRSVLYQPIVSSAADFQLISGYLNAPTTAGAGSKADKTTTAAAAAAASLYNEKVELVRLYRILLPTLKKDSAPAAPASGDAANQIRVFSVMSFDMVERLVKQGWKSLNEPVLFSTNNGLLTSLLSDRFLSLRESKLGADFLAALQSHHIVGGNKGGKGVASGDGVAEGFKLQDAMNKKILYVVCCKLTMASDIIKTSSLSLPASRQSRESLLSELLACRGAQGFVVDAGDTANGLDRSMLFVMPSPLHCEELVEVDFLGLCLSPPLEDGVHTIENKLEMLALPGNTVDMSRALLSDFEEGAAEEVKQFVDRVLFEVDESQSATLMKAEKEVVLRETALKKLRDEIEKERKVQEGTLREMRQNVGQYAEGGAQGGNSSKGKGNPRK